MTTVGDRLYFFPGSTDLPPGQGSTNGSPARPATVLADVWHWRSMLSNFWPADFTLGERNYRTVEHAFQAAKIA